MKQVGRNHDELERRRLAVSDEQGDGDKEWVEGGGGQEDDGGWIAREDWESGVGDCWNRVGDC